MAIAKKWILTIAWCGTMSAIAVVGCTMPDDAGTTDPVDDYDVALQRVQSGSCEGLFWRTGTCGDFLFITEGGYTAIINYYDPATGQRVAREFFTDFGSSGKSPPDFDCDPKVEEESGLCEDGAS